MKRLCCWLVPLALTLVGCGGDGGDSTPDAGADVEMFEFAAAEDIPHNSIDPAADAAKKALVYAKILEMLGE